MNAVMTAYQLAYQISPIILQNGIATAIPGGLLPIVAITEGASFSLNALGGDINLDLSQFFAHFEPAPGSTLASYDIGTYPFANQTVAANAVIKKPNIVSLVMACPVKGRGGYAARLATMTILQQTIEKHVSLGGTFTVATPASIYTNCLLQSLSDISGGGTNQKQYQYRWDFVQPLITETAAEAANSDYISKITSGVKV